MSVAQSSLPKTSAEHMPSVLSQPASWSGRCGVVMWRKIAFPLAGWYVKPSFAVLQSFATCDLAMGLHLALADPPPNGTSAYHS